MTIRALTFHGKGDVRYETRPDTSPSSTVRPQAGTFPPTTPAPIRPDRPFGEPPLGGAQRPVDPVGGVMPDPASPTASRR